MHTLDSLRLVVVAASLAACGSVKAPAFDAQPGDASTVIDSGPCIPADPATEICGNGIDEDCNDSVDDPDICDGSAVIDITTDPSGGAWASADVVVQAAPASGVTGTLECRSGKVASDGTLSTSFVACGTNAFTPTLDPSTTGDGVYRTELRILHDDGVISDAVHLSYYLHTSLEGALACSLPVTAEVLFAKALERLPTKVTDTDPTLTFRTDANVTDDGFAHVANPFIRINFTPRDSRGFGFGSVTAEALGPFDGGLQVLSLRRHFEFNADRSLVMISRRYAARRSPDTNVNCEVMHVRRSPESGATKVSDLCHAIVLNREGAGVCLRIGGGNNITFPFSPPASVTSSLASTLLGETPLTPLVDNAMWRKVGLRHSVRPATLEERDACSGDGATCTQLGRSGRWGWRNFSPKCYGDPSCTTTFDAQHVVPSGNFSALYLPDDEFFTF